MKGFSRNNAQGVMETKDIDYKNIRFLKRCITEGGKIIPARMTGCSRSQQALINKAIKRARFLALIPYTIN